MPEDSDLTTSICMFHHPAPAQAAVKDLIALGLPTSQIAVLGDARTDLAGETSTATLGTMRVPEADMAMLMDGLRDGGTIVAVRASAGYAVRIDHIFKDHSATVVDEKLMNTNADTASVRHAGTDAFVNPHTANFDTIERNRLDMDDPEDV